MNEIFWVASCQRLELRCGPMTMEMEDGKAKNGKDKGREWMDGNI